MRGRGERPRRRLTAATRLMRVAGPESVREVLRFHGIPENRATLRLTIEDAAEAFTSLSAHQLTEELQEALDMDAQLEWPD